MMVAGPGWQENCLHVAGSFLKKILIHRPQIRSAWAHWSLTVNEEENLAGE